LVEEKLVKIKAMLIAVLALAVAAVAGCGGASDETGGNAAASSGDSSKAELSIVAYSTPQVVYDEIIPEFQATSAGAGVGFKSSYGGSGDQSRAVIAGQPADYVAFALQPDMDKLVDEGLVADDWDQTETKGLVSKSVVVFVVRKGNPKGIKSWDDLLKPGVGVITPNPFSSGGAKWNLMAAYGAASDAGKDPEAGLAYLRELITDHVEVQDKSARESLQTFLGGNGDVALSYENEAVTAQKKGEDIDYVVPDDTIQIENPVAVTLNSKAPEAAGAFLKFALSKEAQQKFSDWGYRPVNSAVAKATKDKFVQPSGLFTIDDLGGWDDVNEDFFDVETGSVAKIEEDAGVSTAG